MAEGYTHITVILDRTGSMESIRDDTIGGFNAFLDKQRSEPGRATITLVQFDSQDPFEVVYACKDAKDAPRLTAETYVPRASTPLLDAMARGMLHLDEALASAAKGSEPEHVLFVVITDGLENASREFSRADVVRMIAQRKEKGWQFVFLSADLDAVEEAGALGVAYASRMAFAKSPGGVHAALDALSDSVADVRACRSVRVEFRDSDRAKQDEERTKAE